MKSIIFSARAEVVSSTRSWWLLWDHTWCSSLHLSSAPACLHCHDWCSSGHCSSSSLHQKQLLNIGLFRGTLKRKLRISKIIQIFTVRFPPFIEAVPKFNKKFGFFLRPLNRYWPVCHVCDMCLSVWKYSCCRRTRRWIVTCLKTTNTLLLSYREEWRDLASVLEEEENFTQCLYLCSGWQLMVKEQKFFLNNIS